MVEKEYIERGKAFENEYISRREAIKARKRSCNGNCLECDFAIDGDSWCKGEVFVVDLLRIPAADVRPVVRAHIVDMRYAEDDGEWKCTHCGWQYTLCVCGKDVTSKIHFCPNCGADMREES